MTTSRLERLLKQKETHSQKIKRIDDQVKQIQALETKRKRKDDTRRCIITGRYAQQHAQANPDSDFAKKLNSLLDEYVTRKGDRALLGLPPVEQSTRSSNDNLKNEFDKTNNNPTPEGGRI